MKRIWIILMVFAVISSFALSAEAKKNKKPCVKPEIVEGGGSAFGYSDWQFVFVGDNQPTVAHIYVNNVYYGKVWHKTRTRNNGKNGVFVYDYTEVHGGVDADKAGKHDITIRARTTKNCWFEYSFEYEVINNFNFLPYSTTLSPDGNSVKIVYHVYPSTAEIEEGMLARVMIGDNIVAYSEVEKGTWNYFLEIEVPYEEYPTIVGQHMTTVRIERSVSQKLLRY